MPGWRPNRVAGPALAVVLVGLLVDGSDVHRSVATVAGAGERVWCGTANRSDGVIEE